MSQKLASNIMTFALTPHKIPQFTRIKIKDVRLSLTEKERRIYNALVEHAGLSKEELAVKVAEVI